MEQIWDQKQDTLGQRFLQRNGVRQTALVDVVVLPQEETVKGLKARTGPGRVAVRQVVVGWDGVVRRRRPGGAWVVPLGLFIHSPTDEGPVAAPTRLAC